MVSKFGYPPAAEMTLAELESALAEMAREYLSPATTGKQKYALTNVMSPYIIRWQTLTGRTFQIGAYR